MTRGRTLVGWTVGLALAISLAVVVGQRLSAQTMAVVIGLIVGVAVSVPASLIVVWVTARLTLPSLTVEPARPEPYERRVVYVHPQPAQPAPAYPAPAAAAYAAPSAGPYAPAGYTNSSFEAPALLPPRRFTVATGGRPSASTLADDNEETLWTP